MRSISVQLCPYQYPDSFMRERGGAKHFKLEGYFQGGEGAERGVHRSRTPA